MNERTIGLIRARVDDYLETSSALYRQIMLGKIAYLLMPDAEKPQWFEGLTV